MPGDPELHRTLGDLRVRQGRLAAAAIHYERARLFAHWPRVTAAVGASEIDAFRLGEVHEALGMLPEAVGFYGMARHDKTLAAEAERRIQRITGGR